jgi:enoyl-CoA hydratase
MDRTQKVLNITDLDSGILQVSFNRPAALNSLNLEFMHEFHEFLLATQASSAVKAILLTGEGKAFCAGADINYLATLTSQRGIEFARYGQKIFRLLEQLGKPSLAAVNGFALGGGCELAMAATLRIAADTAIFGQPEIKLGVIPGFGGTQRLSRLIGKGRALELCLTGRTIKAADAYAWGLVSEVTPADNLLSRAREILNQLVKLPLLAQKSLMTVIDSGYDLALDDALELEAAHFGLCCATRDKTEGVSAFLEKRAPAFVGE